MMLFMDEYSHYGTDITQLTAGIYTGSIGLSISLGVPTWDTTGQISLDCGQGNLLRKVLDGGAVTSLLIGAHIGNDSLPSANDQAHIFSFNDAGNATIARLTLQSTGVLALYSGANVLLAASAAPVIVSETWQYVEMKLDPTGQTFRLDVDGTTVISASSLSALSGSIAQIAIGNMASGGGNRSCWYKDLNFRDTSGSHNNGFEGEMTIAALYPNADGPDQGWTPQYRHLYGTGILDATFLSSSFGDDTGACISCASSTSLDLGAGDYTLEGWYRFKSLPTGSTKAHLTGKWDETNNRRSYQLYLGGPTLESGNLVFRISTDGGAGTVTELVSYPWIPETDTWYHVAVVRASGEVLVFIDGIQLGLPAADSATYFVGAAPLGICGQMEGSSLIVKSTHMTGWVDEVRMTVGFARYTADFTPSGPFPRGSGSDPQWADVVLLCGFDSGIADESSYLRTVTARESAVAITPDDGAAAFQAINKHTPFDDTFIEAALTAASSILTLSANPAVNDTVTVGSYTSSGSHAAVYKFVSALASAFDVKIGATVAITLANLRAAINLLPGAGTLYGTSTIVNDVVTAFGLPGSQMGVAANVPGTSGNSIASTSSLTHGGGWTGTTLAGGADIPGDSDFYFDRPPVHTTLIRAVQVVNRSYKTDSGTGSVQVSFVGPLGGSTDGTDNPLTLTPTYRYDVFEEDPDTSGSITPSTLVGGRVRVNRTE